MIKRFAGYEDSLKDFIEYRKVQDSNDVREIVCKILNDIRIEGDRALFQYCSKFDSTNLSPENLLINENEILKAYNSIDNTFLDIIRKAIRNIKDFHKNQLQKSWMMTSKSSCVLGQQVTPIENVGIYVPGGTASYPSSVLMNAIPARIAGVKRIAMATPCKDGTINPYTIVAANECGIKEIYKMGGAQAIGAFAYGTESVGKVEKIVGPGNVYVAAAKKEVYGTVDIDMIAGPSEILIIADEFANAKYIAADMMSQAEHDVLASAVLVTNSSDLIERVVKELEVQHKTLDRKDIIIKSLEERGAAVLVDTIKDAVDVANNIAPEHLEVMVKKPMELLGSIKNAGSIFLGDFSPEPLGDYFAGPNHVLPTGGTASFFSPLSVDSFIKKSSFIYYSQNALEQVSEDIQKFAGFEGLSAHGNAVKVRF